MTVSDQPIGRARASAICIADEMILCVRLQDPISRKMNLFPPGGAIEPNESPIEAAIRETREETGFVVNTIAGLSPFSTHYPFVWAGKTYQCETWWVCVSSALPKRLSGLVQDAAYNLGWAWIPISEVHASFSHSRPILDAVQSALESWKQLKDH